MGIVTTLRSIRRTSPLPLACGRATYRAPSSQSNVRVRSPWPYAQPRDRDTPGSRVRRGRDSLARPMFLQTRYELDTTIWHTLKLEGSFLGCFGTDCGKQRTTVFKILRSTRCISICTAPNSNTHIAKSSFSMFALFRSFHLQTFNTFC